MGLTPVQTGGRDDKIAPARAVHDCRARRTGFQPPPGHDQPVKDRPARRNRWTAPRGPSDSADATVMDVVAGYGYRVEKSQEERPDCALIRFDALVSQH